MGDYHRFVQTDWNKAIEQYNLARKADPQNAEILSQIAFSQQGAGLWEDARATLEEGIRLDPRSASVGQRLARTYLWLRKYPEAERASQRLVSLVPSSAQPYQSKVMVQLAQGNLEEARKVLHDVPRSVDPTQLVAYFANYWDLYWVLDDQGQQLLLRLDPAPFGDDRGAWGIVLAQTHYLRGDLARARIYADSAVIENGLLLKATPTDDQRHSFMGLAYAILGNKAEAMRYGERAIAITPMTRDAYTGVYLKYILARIYMMVGETDRAIDQLESVLRVPFYVSPSWLRVDPEWNPIRNNPRFKALTG
jgi:tetratricopeptide (TPR) repeat protein